MLSVFQRQKPIGYCGKKRAVRTPRLNATIKTKSDVFHIGGSQVNAKGFLT